MFLKKVFIFLIFSTLFSHPAFAYNFLYIHPTTGQPIGWAPGTTIRYYVDPGSLGRLTNEQARTLLRAAMDIWENASPYADVPHFEYGGLLREDINGTNYSSYVDLDTCYTSDLSDCDSQAQRDLKTVIIFDEDGSILSNELCRIRSCVSSAGAHVFSGSQSNPEHISQGVVVIGPYFGRTTTKVVSVVGNMTHELGHLLGLAHTSINQDVYINELQGYDRYMPTMFFTPIGIYLGHDDYTSDSLNPDDIAGITTLYPAVTATANLANISGKIFKSDGSPMMHVNVIARNSSDPLCEAISFLSGRQCHPISSGGLTCFADSNDVSRAFYTLRVPPNTYYLEVEEIADNNLRITLSPGLIADENIFGDSEFWNIEDAIMESNTAKNPISLSMGTVRTETNIILNLNTVTSGRLKYFPISTFTPGPGTRCSNSPVTDYAALIGVTESINIGTGGSTGSGGTPGDSESLSSGCSVTP